MFDEINKKLLFGITLIVILLAGTIFSFLPAYMIEGHRKDFSSFALSPSYQNPAEQKPSQSQAQPLLKQTPLQQAFKDAVTLMENQHYHQSLPFWHKVLKLAPTLPEAHVNLGFVMLELERLAEAEKSFNQALQYRPQQANAYWGLALVYEKQNKLPEGIGAMRTYLHFSNDETYKNKARSALWEWEAKINKKLTDKQNP